MCAMVLLSTCKRIAMRRLSKSFACIAFSMPWLVMRPASCIAIAYCFARFMAVVIIAFWMKVGSNCDIVFVFVMV